MSAPFSCGPPGSLAGPRTSSVRPSAGSTGPHISLEGPLREHTRPRPLPTNTTVHELLTTPNVRLPVPGPGPAFIRTSVIVPTNRHCTSHATQLLLPPPQYLQTALHGSSNTAFNQFNLFYDQRQGQSYGVGRVGPPLESWPRPTVIYAEPPQNTASPMALSQARSSEQMVSGTDGPDKSKQSDGHRKSTPHRNTSQDNFMAIDRKLTRLDANGAPLPLTCEGYLKSPVVPLNVPGSPELPVSAPASIGPGLPKMEHLSNSNHIQQNVANLLQESRAQTNNPAEFNPREYFAGIMQNLQAEPMMLERQKTELPPPSQPFVTSPYEQGSWVTANPPIKSPPKKRQYNMPQPQLLNEPFTAIPIKVSEPLPGSVGPPIGQTMLGPGPINILEKDINSGTKKRKNNGTEGKASPKSRLRKPSSSALLNHSPVDPTTAKFEPSFDLPGPDKSLSTSTPNSAPESNPDHELSEANIRSNFMYVFQNVHKPNSDEKPKMFTPDILSVNPFTKVTPFHLKSASPNTSKSSVKSSYRSEFNVRAPREDKMLKFSKTGKANGEDSKYSSFKSKQLEKKRPGRKPRMKETSIEKAHEHVNKKSKNTDPRSCRFSAFPNLSAIGVGGHFFSDRDEFRHSTVVRKAYAVHTGTGKLKLLNEPVSPGDTTTPFCPVNDGAKVCRWNPEENLGRATKPTGKLKKPIKKKDSKTAKDNSEVSKSLSSESSAEAAAKPEIRPAIAATAKCKDGFNTRWSYNKEELKELYKHNAFVIRRTDLSFYAPVEKHYNIYRLIMKDGLILLQKYIPVEDEEQNRVFHYSTNMCLRLEKVDGKFYVKYQPVYYGVCYGTVEDPNIVHVMWRKRIMPTLKFVFELNPLFGDFMNLLEIICCQVLTMKEIERVLNEDDSHPGKESFVKLTKIIDDLSSEMYSHSRWNQRSVEIVKPWPKLWMGNKKEEDKEMTAHGQVLCEICVPSPHSGATRNFWKRACVTGKQYDRVHHNRLEGNFKLPEALRACCMCAEVLVTAHRVYHLKDDMFGCILTILNERLKSDPDLDGNELKKRIMNHDMGHWAREMFLDFCVVLGDGHKALEKMHREANAIKAKIKVDQD